MGCRAAIDCTLAAGLAVAPKPMKGSTPAGPYTGANEDG